jgi:hypothetical protein
VNNIPPIPPGQRLVKIRKPDGTEYGAVFGNKYWVFDFKPVACVGRLVNGAWSHGMLRKGETIVEVDAHHMPISVSDVDLSTF